MTGIIFGQDDSYHKRFLAETLPPQTSDEPTIAAPAADAPPQSVGFLISQLGFASSKGFIEALAPIGIDPGEWTLLRFVAAAEGQSQQALAERLGVPPSRMVAIVDRLEEAGLLERKAYPDDRRIRALHLTSEGRDVLARAVRTAVEYEAKLCSPLAEGEREQLIELLQKLQPGLVERRGVHPGLGRRPPEGLEG
jgi:DNA-binding MarR family transcriptional regulator